MKRSNFPFIIPKGKNTMPYGEILDTTKGKEAYKTTANNAATVREITLARLGKSGKVF